MEFSNQHFNFEGNIFTLAKLSLLFYYDCSPCLIFGQFEHFLLKVSSIINYERGTDVSITNILKTYI